MRLWLIHPHIIYRIVRTIRMGCVILNLQIVFLKTCLIRWNRESITELLPFAYIYICFICNTIICSRIISQSISWSKAMQYNLFSTLCLSYKINIDIGIGFINWLDVGKSWNYYLRVMSEVWPFFVVLWKLEFLLVYRYLQEFYFTEHLCIFRAFFEKILPNFYPMGMVRLFLENWLLWILLGNEKF